MINYPVFLINRSLRRKNALALFDWAQSHKSGIIIFQHIEGIGESDSIESYLNKLNPLFEIVVLFTVRKNGKKLIVFGGDSRGIYTKQLRQWLSFKNNIPFLFIKRQEAEYLYLKLKTKRLDDSNLNQDKRILNIGIDWKTIERCLLFYSEDKPSKIEDRYGNLFWIKQKLLHVIKYDSVKSITIWGEMDQRWKDVLSSIPLVKRQYYTPPSVDSQTPLCEDQLYRSVRGTDALLIGRPLEQFTSIQLGKLREQMAKSIIIDPFYLFESEELKALNWKYIHP